MSDHRTGTREGWRAARLELLEAEKELTRRSDQVAALAKLQAYKQRMGWSFPWASSHGFNADFQVAGSEEQYRSGVGEYNYREFDLRSSTSSVASGRSPSGRPPPARTGRPTPRSLPG